ncbi:MAG: hypothetical protein AAF654_13355 [Myxococcota bacterium]
MNARWTYLAILSLAFLAGLAGTVFAARALQRSGPLGDSSPALHQPSKSNPLPTVEC